MKFGQQQSRQFDSAFYSVRTYLKAGAVFALTTAGYFLAKTTTRLWPDWLQWSDASRDAALTVADKTEMIVSLHQPHARQLLQQSVSDTVVIGLGQYPKIATLANGNFVITWDGIDGITAQIYSSAGIPQGNQFLVSNNIDNTPGLQVAPLATGGFIITWFYSSDGLYSSGGESAAARLFSSGGAPITGEFPVCTGQPFYHDGEEKPNVAALTTGNSVIVCQLSDIYVQMVSSTGALVGSSIQVATPSSSPGIDIYVNRPAIAALATGGFVVVWEQEEDDLQQDYSTIHSGDIYARLYSSNGAPISGGFRVNSQVGIDVNFYYPRVSGLINGDFVIVWGSQSAGLDGFSGIGGRLFSSSGTPLGTEISISDDVGFPFTVGLANGNFLILAERFDQNAYSLGTYARNFSSNGNLMSVFQMGSSDLFFTGGIAGLAGDNFVVAWQNASYTVSFQIFTDISPIIPISPYEYAQMSNQAYQSACSINLGSGWKCLTNSNAMTSILVSGYYGVAYINPAEKNLVIAQRGTQINSPADLYSDFQLALGDIPAQLQDANSFYQFVKNYINARSTSYSGGFNSYHLSFTGHSLGAVLAELSAATWGNPAVTFESPGSLEIVNNNPGGYPFASSVQVQSYNAAPNLINTVNNHLSPVFRVYSPYSAYYGDNVAVSYPLYTLDQHSMSKMVAQFNPARENLYLSSAAKTWPSSGADTFRNFDINRYYWQMGMSQSVMTNVDFISGLLRGGAGVVISGDDSSNIFWGGTNFADQFSGGLGGDTYWPFDGADVITDTGGMDVYHVLSTSSGTLNINDAGRVGILQMDQSYRLAGNASSTEQANTYLLAMTTQVTNWGLVGLAFSRTVHYHLVEDSVAHTLTISPGDNSNNYRIILNNFANGQFGIFLQPTVNFSASLNLASPEGGGLDATSSGSTIIGLGGDDIINVRTPGGHTIYIGAGQDQIIYHNPSLPFRRLLTVTDSDFIGDFGVDDALILVNYQPGDYVITYNTSGAIIDAPNLPTIFLDQVTGLDQSPILYNETLPAAMIVLANMVPILVTNQLLIHQGESVMFTTKELDVYDIDSGNITFAISNCSNGYFHWLNESLSIVEFTLLDVLQGIVNFSHDGSRQGPAYWISTSDGLSFTEAKPANVTFIPAASKQSGLDSRLIGVIAGASIGGGILLAAVLKCWLCPSSKKADRSEGELPSTSRGKSWHSIFKNKPQESTHSSGLQMIEISPG